MSNQPTRRHFIAAPECSHICSSTRTLHRGSRRCIARSALPAVPRHSGDRAWRGKVAADVAVILGWTESMVALLDALDMRDSRPPPF